MAGGDGRDDVLLDGCVSDFASESPGVAPTAVCGTSLSNAPPFHLIQPNATRLGKDQARASNSSCQLCIKLESPSCETSGFRESKNRLVTADDIGERDGVHFLVMELVEGRDRRVEAKMVRPRGLFVRTR